MKKKSIKNSEKTIRDNLEERFDAGASVLDYFDTDNAIVRVNVDFPAWVVKALDRESERRGVARQALLKMWVADRIDSLRGGAKLEPASPRRRNGV